MIAELNTFAKNILKIIARDYKDELGNENIQLLYSLLSKDFVVLDNHKKSEMNLSEELYQTCFPTSHYFSADGNLHLQVKENSEIKQNLMVGLFSYFIHPTPNEETNQDLLEFYTFLTVGLTHKYAQDLCLRNNIEEVFSKRYKANIEFVSSMLEVLPKEISKDKTVFQYSYPYILELCQISSEQQNHYGNNCYTRYEKHYLKKQNYLNLIQFLLDTYPEQKNINKKIPFLILKYQEIGTIEFAHQDLMNIYAKLYQHDPLKKESLKKQIDEVFLGTYIGQAPNKGTSRILAPTGFLEGSIVVILSILLGIILSIFLLK